ncbi:MAG: hypothetical protein ABFS14_03125 [Gemmatimonadota bacterium]
MVTPVGVQRAKTAFMVAVLLLWTTAACTESGRPSGQLSLAADSAVVRTDSAGIWIVTSSTPVWTEGTAWRLGPEPTLTLPSVDSRGNRHFFNVSAAHRYPDGRLMVSDIRAKQLRFYSPKGKFLGAGDRPAGRGRFATIAGFVLGPADSLAVFDIHSNASILSPKGQFVRRLTLPDERRSRVRLLSWQPDGSFVAFESRREQTLRSEGWPREKVFVTVRPGTDLNPGATEDDDRVTTIATWAVPDLQYFHYRGISSDSMIGGYVTPFTTRPSSTVQAGRLFAAQGPDAEVHIWNLGAELAHVNRIFRFSRPRVATAGLQERNMERYRRWRERRDRAWSHAFFRAMEQATVPDSVYSIRKIMIDGPGNIWLGHRWPDDGEWTVLTSDGVWLGSVKVEDGMTPLDVGDDWILVRTEAEGDENDLFSVRLYDLQKPERQK